MFHKAAQWNGHREFVITESIVFTEILKEHETFAKSL